MIITLSTFFLVEPNEARFTDSDTYELQLFGNIINNRALPKTRKRGMMERADLMGN